MENASINDKLLRLKCLCAQGSVLIGMGAILLVSGGCGQVGTSIGGNPDQNPFVQKARKAEQQRDYQAAAGFYQRALETDPRLACAHWELGLLCDEKLGDPVTAIYHYRQFLELDPQTDKRQLAEDFIERAKLSMVSKLPQTAVVDPAELTRLQNENAALTQENAGLRARVAELQGQAVAATVTAIATEPATGAPVNAAAAPDESNKARTHIVQKGDTLQALALKYYGTRSAWDKIYAVNRNVLASKDQLRIGQQLLIP